MLLFWAGSLVRESMDKSEISADSAKGSASASREYKGKLFVESSAFEFFPGQTEKQDMDCHKPIGHPTWCPCMRTTGSNRFGWRIHFPGSARAS